MPRLVECACGCGGTRSAVDRKGRPRRYIWGHTNNGNIIPIKIRFSKKAKKTPVCWLWIGNRDKDGYGKIWYLGKTIHASRVSWLLYWGKLPPDGKMVLHGCDNPSCVRPDHLFLGDVKSNAEDAIAKNRYRHGENHPRSRLTESGIVAIRRVFDGTSATSSILAERFQTTPQNIRAIALGKTWKHLPMKVA